ncbi:MAG TPA: glycosyltransferase [Tepidisphaeraceae bacterium]|nr:glycosyltransferase [Tepidisphaeraceae bacterium]
MFSIVICSRDDHRFAAVAKMYRRLLADRDVEVIRVADARSLAEGYNRAVRQSQGDVLILSHDDVEILSPGFADRVEAHLDRFDVVGVAGTSRLVHAKWAAAGAPYIFGQVAYPQRDSSGYTVAIYGVPSRAVGEIQAMDGLLLAARRTVLDQVTFDAETFDGFHLYDLDFTFRAYRAGFSLGVANDLYVLHESGGDYGASWLPYARRLIHKHGIDLSPSRRPMWHRWAVVEVLSREQVIEVMTPAYWDAEADGPKPAPGGAGHVMSASA